MAWLVEHLLPAPEVRGSKPVFGKIYIEHLFTVNCIEKTKIRKKEARNGSFKKSCWYHRRNIDGSTGLLFM